MLDNWPILSLLIALPLVTGIFLSVRSAVLTAITVGRVSLLACWVVLFLTIYLWFNFDPAVIGYQNIEKIAWLPALGISYYLGLDGLSLLLLLMSNFVFLLAVLYIVYCENIKRKTFYLGLFLILQGLTSGIFLALDLVLFYIFFEFSLLPMFFMIGLWGGENRIYAAFKFFLYTLAGSLPFLIAVAYLIIQSGTADMTILSAYDFSFKQQCWLWAAFFLAFAIKMPMWPVHTWLPDAHVQAPTTGSVILAAVLLKIGGYGLIRLNLPFFPDASVFFMDFVFILSVIAVLYASAVAFAQTDIKKLVAYSSVAHMGFVTMGIFALNLQGLQAGIYQMVSHGFISAALFFMIGMLYNRYHTRELSFYGGLAIKMPLLAVLFAFFTMANVGLPGTSGFIGEFLAIFAVFKVQPVFAILAAFGVIFAAAYGLKFYRGVMFGDLRNPDLQNATDIRVIEVLILGALAVLSLILGVYTAPIFELSDGMLQNLLQTEFMKAGQI